MRSEGLDRPTLDQNSASRTSNIRDLFRLCAGSWLADAERDLIVTSWYEALTAIINSCPDRENWKRFHPHLIGTWLIMAAGSVVADLNPPSRVWTGRAFDAQMNLLFQAMANLAPDPGQGRPIDELVRQLFPEAEKGKDLQAWWLGWIERAEAQAAAGERIRVLQTAGWDPKSPPDLEPPTDPENPAEKSDEE